MGVTTLEGGSVLYLLESYAKGRIARRTFSACRQIAVINRKMLRLHSSVVFKGLVIQQGLSGLSLISFRPRSGKVNFNCSYASDSPTQMAFLLLA